MRQSNDYFLEADISRVLFIRCRNQSK